MCPVRARSKQSQDCPNQQFLLEFSELEGHTAKQKSEETDGKKALVWRAQISPGCSASSPLIGQSLKTVQLHNNSCLLLLDARVLLFRAWRRDSRLLLQVMGNLCYQAPRDLHRRGPLPVERIKRAAKS